MPPSTTAGPSRRSHTKSRKGCKTCKRRHIRCDETFPQCRNCTKHHVRCDYQDASPSETAAAQAAPEAPITDLFYSPEIESILKHWQLTGEASLGDEDVSIDLRARGHVYSLSDLHLLYYALSSIQDVESASFTIITGAMPLFLSIGSSQPFVVHAILAISAGELAWATSSDETKSLAYRHGEIALRGLQDAIGCFSRENAEAVLCAAVLLSWQANDWRSWTSLVQWYNTATKAIQNWGLTTALTAPFVQHQLAFRSPFPPQPRADADQFRRFYGASLQNIDRSLTELMSYLSGADSEEHKWLEQIQDYLQRLLRIEPASSEEEEFNHLYTFRKWILYVPTLLVKNHGQDPMTLLVIGYFYATALRLSPLFPGVGNEIVAIRSSVALDRILQYFGTFQQQATFPYESFAEKLHLLSYPQEALTLYLESRVPATNTFFGEPSPDFADIFANNTMSFANVMAPGINSPGFSTLFASRGSMDSAVSDWSANQITSGLPFLGVPGVSMDSYYASPMTSPALQVRESFDDTYEMMRRSVDFQSGNRSSSYGRQGPSS